MVKFEFEGDFHEKTVMKTGEGGGPGVFYIGDYRSLV
jgi:hypothetical protein